MPRPLSKRLLSEVKVATRAMPDSMVNAILRSLLVSSGDAILVTDLNHRSLACNQKFAELFQVSAEEAVNMEPEELRKRVYPRLQDPKSWKAQLDQVYGDPDAMFEDELELQGDNPVHLSRTTGPVQDGNGHTVARLWTFRDVSALRRRERMRDALLDLNALGEADPAQVCRLVVQKLAAFYKASALISVREGDRMVFREMAGMPIPFSFARSNKLENSYCQLALETMRPFLVQNGRQHPQLSRIPPARYGFTRYLGVPIIDRAGAPIGTLCIMDGKSSVPLDRDDEEFLSMMGLRVSTELYREQMYLERTAEQRAAMESQKQDLAETHAVVQAMNRAFEMASETMPTTKLVQAQVELLRGLLGYQSAVLLLPDGDGFLNGSASSEKGVRPVRISLSEDPVIASFLSAGGSERPLKPRFQSRGTGALPAAMDSSFLAVAPVTTGGAAPGLIAFGSSQEPAFQDPRHQMLLEALIDQVCLLLTAHSLQRELLSTHDELKATQRRLIQSEKLNVVGTLAASIAHDIRNIVSSLALECSLGDVDPAAALSNVRTQLDRFAVLAHRLLSYARPRLLAREPVHLNELLRGVVALTEAQARVAGVMVEASYASEEPTVLADSSQVEHLFVNLVLNAIQAMRSRGGTIRLQTSVSGGGVKALVSDTGPGIPRAELSNIFEPFHSTRPDGFGLGLYSCKRIVDEHGWSMSIDSIEGRGTTFQICMPLRESVNA